MANPVKTGDAKLKGLIREQGSLDPAPGMVAWLPKRNAETPTKANPPKGGDTKPRVLGEAIRYDSLAAEGLENAV